VYFVQLSKSDKLWHTLKFSVNYLARIFSKNNFSGHLPPALGKDPLDRQPPVSTALCCTREGSEELGMPKAGFSWYKEIKLGNLKLPLHHMN